MGLYQRHLLPWLIDASMRAAMLAPYRRQAAAGCVGRILDIGVGSGLNLAFLPLDRDVVGIDPSAALLAKVRRQTAAGAREVMLIRGAAERLPLVDGSFDSVLLTWTLCSIAHPAAALAEIRRVLRPDGMLHYVEHGAAPEHRVRRMQDHLTPAWRRISGGCHLNRDIPALLLAAGFRVVESDDAYAPGPKLLTYFYTGRAVAA